MYKQTQTMYLISRSLINFKKSASQAKLTIPAIKNRITLLQSYFTDVRNMDAELYHLSDEARRSSHAYYTEDQFNNCATCYEEALDSLHEKIAELESSLSVRSLSPVDQQINDPDIEAISYPQNCLPTFVAPTFDGSFEHWETFRDRFTSMFIDNQNISNASRLYWLSLVLFDEAKKAISHLPINDANYSVAWGILTSRYENTHRKVHLLIHTHLQAIFSLPQVTSESSEDLEQLRDKISSSIQALKNLGRPVDQWDDILVYIVSQKLDKASREAWELKLSGTQNAPTYTMLSTFLDSRIRALDAFLPVLRAGTSSFSHDKST